MIRFDLLKCEGFFGNLANERFPTIRFDFAHWDCVTLQNQLSRFGGS